VPPPEPVSVKVNAEHVKVLPPPAVAAPATGIGFTEIVLVAEAVQLAAEVPITVYVVITEVVGIALTVGPVVVTNPPVAEVVHV
jgi:hypothetical protein